MFINTFQQTYLDLMERTGAIKFCGSGPSGPWVLHCSLLVPVCVVHWTCELQIVLLDCFCLLFHVVFYILFLLTGCDNMQIKQVVGT